MQLEKMHQDNSKRGKTLAREKEGGMLNKIALGITDLGKDFNEKAVDGKGILKATHFLVGLFLALVQLFSKVLCLVK